MQLVSMHALYMNHFHLCDAAGICVWLQASDQHPYMFTWLPLQIQKLQSHPYQAWLA